MSLFWCPWCGDVLRMITSEDLECKCGFNSSKTKEKKDLRGRTIYRESYRNVKKVYEWFPEVLTQKPSEGMFSIQGA